MTIAHVAFKIWYLEELKRYLQCVDRPSVIYESVVKRTLPTEICVDYNFALVIGVGHHQLFQLDC